MSLIRLSLLLILICSFFQCELEQQGQIPLGKMELKEKSLFVLLFRKELKLELWSADDSAKERIATALVKSQLHYPFGIYDLHFTDGKWFADLTINKALRKRPLLNNRQFPIKQDDLLSLLATKDTHLLTQQLELAKDVQILVFPNDSRSGEAFIAYLNGEVWLPEVYSSLELWLREFR